MIFSALRSFSQAQDRVLIAKETWYQPSGKSGAFRIITSNDSIAHKIMSKYGSVMTKFTYTQKKDRAGYYWERSFYFKKEHYDTIALYINNKFQ